VDRALERYLVKQAGSFESIWRAMRYGLFPGGKRIRPILTLAAGELFAAKQKELLPFACAIEMIHAYSLIHDD
jgi:geranylgeranyl diphosphate synthase type II